MADYSLIRPDRRVGDPSSAEVGLLQQMQGAGANQMVGFLNAARLDRQQGDADYTLAVDAQNAQRLGLQQEADAREVEQANLQRTNALRTAAIYSPAGAANVQEAYSLLTPEGQARATQLAGANVELTAARAARAAHTGTGNGAGRGEDGLTAYQRRMIEERGAERGSRLEGQDASALQRYNAQRTAAIDRAVRDGTPRTFMTPDRLATLQSTLRAQAEARFDASNPPPAPRAVPRSAGQQPQAGGTPAATGAPSAQPRAAVDAPSVPVAAPASPRDRALAAIAAAGIVEGSYDSRRVVVQGNNLSLRMSDGTTRVVPMQ